MQETGRDEWMVYADSSLAAPHARRGVAMSGGDGTVPLVSLGGQCRSGWLTDALNPARLPVKVIEYADKPWAYPLM